MLMQPFFFVVARAISTLCGQILPLLQVGVVYSGNKLTHSLKQIVNVVVQLVDQFTSEPKSVGSNTVACIINILQS